MLKRANCQKSLCLNTKLVVLEFSWSRPICSLIPFCDRTTGWVIARVDEVH